jgi:hypothetical protein
MFPANILVKMIFLEENVLILIRVLFIPNV